MAARVLAWIATAAGLTLIVVLVTGGFRFELGPVHVSAHGVVPPLLLMALTGGALLWWGRAREAFAGITADITNCALAAALVGAGAIASVGVSFGTFAASSADASAYVSHSALIDSGRLTMDEPLARAVGWHEATWTFTPLGYRPGRTPGTLVPGYPLGLPLVMAGARRVAGEVGPFLVGPAFAALAVLAAYAIAAWWATARAGVIAAVLLASSPIVQFQTVQPMSDVPAMAWWALSVACAMRRTRTAATAAGTLAGMALLTRPSLAPLGVVVAAVALGWPRSAPSSSFDRRRLGWYLVGLAPGVLAVAALQRYLYGSPVQTGYGDISDFFAIANIWPNLGDYFQRLLAGEGPALTLAVAALAILVIRRRALAKPAAALVTLAAACVAVVLAIYLPYGVFPDWSSFRFLMPALPMAFAAVGAVASEALDQLAAPVRGVVTIASLTLLVSLNVTHAAQQSVYVMGDYEARYRTVGRYLEASMPRDTVIVTSQESGSARFYTGLPVLRWDLLAVDLETAIARLRTLGRHPILVVEDWEKPGLRERFPGPLASLDWPPRAEAGQTTRVGVWDPADRTAPPGSIVTKRLP